jgi:hypothetical protein
MSAGRRNLALWGGNRAEAGYTSQSNTATGLASRGLAVSPIVYIKRNETRNDTKRETKRNKKGKRARTVTRKKGPVVNGFVVSLEKMPL